MGSLEFIQSVSGGIYLLTITVMGVRLLMLSRRTGMLPELLLGIAFLCGGTLGAMLEVVAQQGAEALGPQMSGRLLMSGKLAGGVGLGVYNFFVWRVFRPDEGWAGALFFAVLAVTAVAFAGFAASGTFATGVVDGRWFWLEFAARVVSPAWLAFESFRYYGAMRRRVALGLADPLVANRFLLWGAGALLGLLMLCTSLPPRFLGSDHPLMPIDIIVLGTAGIATSACYWLAFFPPAPFERWVTGSRAA